MPNTATASSRHSKKNTQPRDEISEPDLLDDLQSDKGEIDEGTTKAHVTTFLEQPVSKKSLGRSRAFQTQKETRYGEARKNGKELVRDGIAFLEDVQGKLANFHAQDIPFEKYHQDCHLPLTAQQRSFECAQTLYPPLLENLGRRRAHQVDAACNMLKNKGAQRQEALKEFSKYARAQVEQGRQNEKDAADANAFIKGYKALQRS